MEKIEVKSFYIFKDGGYRLIGNWYGRRIEFETHPQDAPELRVNDKPIEGSSELYESLIEMFPIEEWNTGDRFDQAYKRFSAIQRVADDIMIAIINLKEPMYY